MSVAPWQYFKSPCHPPHHRKGCTPKQWDLLRPVAYHREHFRSQAQSSLCQLPAEIRGKIFHYALSPYINYTKLRQNNKQHAIWLERRYRTPANELQALFTSFHPTHHAGEKYHIAVDIALLRTCQRVYQETWWIPFATAEFKFIDGAALKHESRLEDILEIYHRRHSLRVQQHRVEINHVQVLGPSLIAGIKELASLSHFYPRCITLTERNLRSGDCLVLYPYTHHYPMIKDAWVPPSVREVRVQLEATESKRDDLLLLAALITATWAFDRVDGVRMLADPDQRLRPYIWMTCLSREDHYLSIREPNHRLGVTVVFKSVDRVDERASLPLDLPIVHSQCLPLQYGPRGQKTPPCRMPEGLELHDRTARLRYALNLAKHPFVSRWWLPPPPLPDTPGIEYCAACDHRNE